MHTRCQVVGVLSVLLDKSPLVYNTAHAICVCFRVPPFTPNYRRGLDRLWDRDFWLAETGVDDKLLSPAVHSGWPEFTPERRKSNFNKGTKTWGRVGGGSSRVRGRLLPISLLFQPELAVRRKGGKLFCFFFWLEWVASFLASTLRLRRRWRTWVCNSLRLCVNVSLKRTWANLVITTNFLPSSMCAVVTVGRCGIIPEDQVSAGRAHVAARRSAPVWRQPGANRAQEFGMQEEP